MVRSGFYGFVGVLVGGLSAAGVHAADLDGPRRRPLPPVVVEGWGPPLPPPPPVYAFVPPRPRSPCRVIAAPEFNLSQDDIARTRPQVVCLSRGLYGDALAQP